MCCNLLLHSLLLQIDNDWGCSSPCRMPNASYSLLPYQVSALDKLLLANATGQRYLVSGTLPVEQFIHFLPVEDQLQANF